MPIIGARRRGSVSFVSFRSPSKNGQRCIGLSTGLCSKLDLESLPFALLMFDGDTMRIRPVPEKTHRGADAHKLVADGKQKTARCIFSRVEYLTEEDFPSKRQYSADLQRGTIVVKIPGAEKKVRRAMSAMNTKRRTPSNQER